MEGCLEGHVLAAQSMASGLCLSELLVPWLYVILCDDQSQTAHHVLV